jgi:hypothetical protein
LALPSNCGRFYADACLVPVRCTSRASTRRNLLSIGGAPSIQSQTQDWIRVHLGALDDALGKQRIDLAADALARDAGQCAEVGRAGGGGGGVGRAAQDAYEAAGANGVGQVAQAGQDRVRSTASSRMRGARGRRADRPAWRSRP